MPQRDDDGMDVDMGPTRAVADTLGTDVGPAALQRLGRYTLVSLLGKGGMAEVYLATQDGPMGFAKTCVVKRIRRSLSEEPRFVEMFLREARVAARLNHPNAVQIFELGQDGGEYFLAMEFLDGVSLHRAARRCWHHGESVPMEVVLRATADAALGLHHAHSLVGPEGKATPLVHRDVSPDNIMLTRDGVSKVLDFGIAKSTDVEEVTGTGEIKGKIPFMSPEQLQGLPLDRRSDLWSLGVTMYWLLTGKRPFDATSEPMTIDGIMRRDPARARELNPLIPTAVEQIVMQLLEKDREKRIGSGAELAEKLLSLLGPSAGYGPASTFAAKAMAWPDPEPGAHVPLSALTLIAARPESQWLKRLDADGAGLERLFPERTPTGMRNAVPQGAELPSTGGTVTGLKQAQQTKFPVWPIAAGALAAVALAIGTSMVVMHTDQGPAPVPIPKRPALTTSTSAAPSPAPSPGAGPAPSSPTAPIEATPTPTSPASAASTTSSSVTPAPTKPRVEGGESVRATAPATVSWTLNGKHLGNGTATLKVPKGTSKLTAIDGDTGGSIAVAVVDGAASFQAVPTGTLLVRVKPWADVELGKKKLGQTPIDPLVLKAGHYTVHLVRESQQKTVAVDVKAGATATVTADLRD